MAVGGFKEDLKKDGIKIIFINDVFQNLVAPLQSEFPQYKFYKLSEQKKVLEREVK